MSATSGQPAPIRAAKPITANSRNVSDHRIFTEGGRTRIFVITLATGPSVSAAMYTLWDQVPGIVCPKPFPLPRARRCARWGMAKLRMVEAETVQKGEAPVVKMDDPLHGGLTPLSRLAVGVAPLETAARHPMRKTVRVVVPAAFSRPESFSHPGRRPISPPNERGRDQGARAVENGDERGSIRAESIDLCWRRWQSRGFRIGRTPHSKY